MPGYVSENTFPEGPGRTAHRHCLDAPPLGLCRRYAASRSLGGGTEKQADAHGLQRARRVLLLSGLRDLLQHDPTLLRVSGTGDLAHRDYSREFLDEGTARSQGRKNGRLETRGPI